MCNMGVVSIWGVVAPLVLNKKHHPSGWFGECRASKAAADPSLKKVIVHTYEKPSPLMTTPPINDANLIGPKCRGQ